MFAPAANMQGSDDSNKSLSQTDRSIGSRLSWRDFKKGGRDLDLIRRGIRITNDLLLDRESTQHLDVFRVNMVLKVRLCARWVKASLLNGTVGRS